MGCDWRAGGGASAADTHFVASVSYSPDGTRIVSGSRCFFPRIWDAVSGAPVGKTLVGHSEAVYSVSYSPDGTRIVSGSGDETLRQWDVANWRAGGEPLCWALRDGHQCELQSQWHPDRESGSYDNTLRLWDAETGKPVGEPLRGHSKTVSGVSYSCDGTRIVVEAGIKRTSYGMYLLET